METEDLHETEKFSQLPDTQKIDSDYESCEFGDSCEIWGRLYPLGFNLQPKDLTKKMYQVGRGPMCDIQLTSEQVGPYILTVISKVQFQVQLEVDDSGARVFSLLDLSSNGTYVNNIKLGKNRKVYLSNNDKISVSHPQNKAYLFVDASTANGWLPPSERCDYNIIARLGQGAYGEVQLAIQKRTGNRYAIKKILKNICKTHDEDKNHVANEIKILGTINHINTIRMEDLFENDDAVYIVLEYMPGGDLQQRIDKVGILAEHDAKFYFYQLINGLQYLHTTGIIHRDLKPKNVLLSSDSPDALLKISDFGLSKVMRSASTLKTFCGTLLYTAPEILLSKGCSAYTPLVDIWSLGCILYLCLNGKPVFDVTSKLMPVPEQIVRGYFRRLTRNGMLSDNAIELVDKMLSVDASQRISVEEVLKHPWLEDKPMKLKVGNALENAGKEDLENVSPEFENIRKRRRIDLAATMIS